MCFYHQKSVGLLCYSLSKCPLSRTGIPFAQHFNCQSREPALENAFLLSGGETAKQPQGLDDLQIDRSGLYTSEIGMLQETMQFFMIDEHLPDCLIL